MQRYREGMEALEKGKRAEGVALLYSAVQLSPTDVGYRQAWLTSRERALVSLVEEADRATASKQWGTARDHLAEAKRISPDDARVSLRMGRLDRMVEMPNLLARAAAALDARDVSLAQRMVDRVTELDPEEPALRSLQTRIADLNEADGEGLADLGSAFRQPVRLEFRDAAIRVVFDALSRSTGINFVFDRDVRSDAKTTINVRDVSLDDAISIILATNQLEKKVLNQSSVLIYPSTQPKLKEYQDLVIRSFHLAHADAKVIAGMLKTVLKLKDVYVDERNNVVILREPPETISLAARLVAMNDLDDPEVMLEVAVLEVNRTNLQNLGIQISDQITVSPLGGLSGSGGTAAQSFTINQLRRLNSDSIALSAPSATINLQTRDGEARLLANPSLRVRDREKARVLVGDKVPVVTTTTTANGFVSESIQYLDVGLKLEAEPTVRINNEIGLKISLEVSSLVGSVRTNNGSQAFQIGTRNYSSVLRLRDGETQVLAGLISDEDRASASRLPLVGRLPILGRLFSSQTDNRQKTEIVMSITPRLLRSTVRKEPSGTTIWSGTESAIRARPLRFREASGERAAAPAKTTQTAPSGTPLSVPPPTMPGAAPLLRPTEVRGNAPSAISFLWSSPARLDAKGEAEITLRANPTVGLRALPLQIGFERDDVEVISVESALDAASRSRMTVGHVLDKEAGRISVAVVVSAEPWWTGEVSLVTLRVRARKPSGDVRIALVAANPVGAGPIASDVVVLPQVAIPAAAVN